MSLPTYPIVGIPIQPNKPLPLRQEITAWANNHDNCYQVSLFLRALATVKARAVEDRFGFFQLAGQLDANPKRTGRKLTEQGFIRTLWWNGMV